MPKKKWIWYETDLDFHATKKLLLEKYKSKIIGDFQDYHGRLTFQLNDFKSITFQVTTKGKLGIYYPKEITIKKCLKLIQPCLVKIDGSPVEAFTKIKESSDGKIDNKIVPRKRFRSESERKRALVHSKNLLFKKKYKQGYDSTAPQLVIDKLAFQDLEDVTVSLVVDLDDRCVFQHLKSGYPEVHAALMHYRRLMDETGLSEIEVFPKFRISKTPLPTGGPYPKVLPNIFLTNDSIQELKIPSLSDYLDGEEENPEVAKRYGIPPNVSKEKIKKLLNLRDFLYTQICTILYDVDQGNPLRGACEHCPS